MKTIKTITIPAGQAASICSARPDENFSNSTGLIVSLENRCDYKRNECRTLLQFAQNVLPDGAKLVKATLCLTALKGNLSSIYVFKNLSEFEQGSVTWRTRPKLDIKPAGRACVDTDNIEIDVLSAFRQSHGYFGVTVVAETCGRLLLKGRPFLKLGYYEDQPKPPDINRVENIFDEEIITFSASSEPVRYSSAYEASTAERVTYFIKNTGSNPFVFNIQISPDGADFIDDAQVFTIAPGELRAFTPYLFARYMRAKIVPEVPGNVTSAVLWIQSQTRNYLIQ